MGNLKAYLYRLLQQHSVNVIEIDIFFYWEFDVTKRWHSISIYFVYIPPVVS